MKKPIAHTFDACGQAAVNADHAEARIAALEAEVERLKRIILLQERRWSDSYPRLPKTAFH